MKHLHRLPKNQAAEAEEPTDQEVADRRNRKTVAVGLLIAVLGVGTLWNGVQQRLTEKCVREATAERADANKKDWLAMDAIVDLLTPEPGEGPATEEEFRSTLDDYETTRAESDKIRENTDAAIRGACG